MNVSVVTLLSAWCSDFVAMLSTMSIETYKAITFYASVVYRKKKIQFS